MNLPPHHHLVSSLQLMSFQTRLVLSLQFMGNLLWSANLPRSTTWLHLMSHRLLLVRSRQITRPAPRCLPRPLHLHHASLTARHPTKLRNAAAASTIFQPSGSALFQRTYMSVETHRRHLLLRHPIQAAFSLPRQFRVM